MIAATLPTPVDAAEPAAAPRPPKGAPFAAVIDAVPADTAPDAKTDAADKGDAAAEPAADASAVTPPGAPVADAAALIAQLCPLPAGPTAAPAGADAQSPACLSRESGNPSPAVELDSRIRGNDTGAEGKAASRTAKAARQAGKAAPLVELATTSAAKTIDTSLAPPASLTRAADAPASLDTLATAPPADVAITHHLDMAHDAQWLDRLAQDIARSADANANLRFSLAPEHLGRLTVDLAANADGTSVRLTTESEQAHRIVSEAQPRLVAEARAQGLRISETQVDLDQRQGGQQQPQRSPDGQGGQDRARPAVLWTELPRRTGAVAKGVPAARDLYA